MHTAAKTDNPERDECSHRHRFIYVFMLRLFAQRTPADSEADRDARFFFLHCVLLCDRLLSLSAELIQHVVRGLDAAAAAAATPVVDDVDDLHIR